MFSGIISHLGKISTIKTQPDARVFTICTDIKDLSLGESIAVNGVCLTVTSFDARGQATFFVSSETLSKTALSALREAQSVNLERACTPTTRLSGHIVQGHVDAVGKVINLASEGEAFHLHAALPATLRGYVVVKGSITIDGISLTVNDIKTDSDGAPVIELMIIPHTWQHTTLHDKQMGDTVNIEVDVLAKYVEALLQARALT